MSTQKQTLLFNGDGVDVTERIKAGNTYFFANQKEAIQKSVQIKTYVYWTYDKNGVFAGYAVPK